MSNAGAMVNRGRGGGGAGSPVYQIDFTAIAAGKRIASTKRRVRWRFGFTNQDALSNGETGTACRGEEHDITLVWSITSGKRLILADGQEVHYSISRASICDFSWTMRGNHVLKLVAHASPPMNAQPGFRQYDFFVDGRSFFDMPKVYRLGLAGKDARGHVNAGAPPPAVRHHYGTPNNSDRTTDGRINVAKTEAPTNEDEEEAYFKEAIKASIEEKAKADKKRDDELRKSQIAAQQEASGANLLLDFTSGDPAPAATVPALPAPAPAVDAFSAAPQPTFGDITSEFPAQPAPAPAVYPAPAAPYGAPAATQQVPYGAPAAPAALGASMTATPQVPYGAPAATPQVPYGAPAAPAALGASMTAPAPPAALNASITMPVAPVPAPAAPSSEAPAATPTLSMFDTPKEAPKEPMGTSADQAFAKFAHMDNFVAPKKPITKENPFEAPAPSPSLAGLKAMGGATQGGQKKEIMNAPAGAMVVSGQQQGNWGGGAYAQPGAPAAQPYGQAPAAGQYGGYGAQQYQQTQYQQPQQYQGQYQQPQQQAPGQYYQQQPPQQQGYGMQYPQQR